MLLLDFDGVILPKKYNKIVSVKATQYVQKFIKLPYKEANIMNKYMYTTFGHTVKGLEKLGYKTDIEDFNRYVYHDINYNALFKNIHKDTDVNINDLDYIIDKFNPLIFSNSPKIWYKTALNYMNIDIKSINMGTYLKPDPQIYKDLEKLTDKKIYFVDDNFINFSNTILNPRWENIMLDDLEIKLPDNLNIKVIPKLNHLHKIIP